jgi:hypothetical protein
VSAGLTGEPARGISDTAVRAPAAVLVVLGVGLLAAAFRTDYRMMRRLGMS